MDALERDYPTVLLGAHEPPCLSLYQPTHRHHPDNQQDPIRFRNLVRRIDADLAKIFPARDVRPLLASFHALAADRAFWNHTLDGLAVLATRSFFKVYRLQRPVPELAGVANSFYTKPLLRILQSADRYQILGLSRQELRLFEGNRDALDEIEPAPGVPRTSADVAGETAGAPERKNRVYGPAMPGGTTRHGTDIKEDALAADTERFFRAVDRAVLEQHSRSSGLPLMLAALPEHHHLFRSVSRNPFLMAEAIDVYPDVLAPDALREQAWQRVLPHYLERLASLIERFQTAKANGLGSDALAEVAAAGAAGRIGTLLVDADRRIPGTFDQATGAITAGDPLQSDASDVLDDLGEQALKTGAEVVIVPTGRMPTETGIAAILRY